MAGLGDIIRTGLQLADSVTADLQPNVQHAAWIGNDGRGGSLYAPAVARAALVETKRRKVKDNATGSEIIASHTISFLRPIPPNGAAGRKEPVDPRDKFTLPDGSTGPVVAVNGLTDKSTGASFYYEVYLG